jgi:hypothetical protein
MDQGCAEGASISSRATYAAPWPQEIAFAVIERVVDDYGPVVMRVCRAWHAIGHHLVQRRQYPAPLSAARVSLWAGAGHVRLLDLACDLGWLRDVDDARRAKILRKLVERDQRAALRVLLCRAGWPRFDSMCHAAAARGHSSLLAWLDDVGCSRDPMVCASAIKHGHLDLAQDLVERRDYPLDHDACLVAAAHRGDIAAMTWLRGHRTAHLGASWKDRADSTVAWLEAAAENGQLALLEWAVGRVRRHISISLLLAAARGGHVSCLAWLHALFLNWKDSRGLGSYDVRRLAHNAAINDHAHVLDWLVGLCATQGYDLPEGAHIAECLSMRKPRRLLAWLVERLRDGTFTVDDAMRGELYCHALACGDSATADLVDATGPVSLALCKYGMAVSTGSVALAQCVRAAFPEAVFPVERVGRNSFGVLEWALEHNILSADSPDLWYRVANKGAVNILDWLARRAKANHLQAAQGAIDGDQTQVLLWLCARGHPLGREACNVAARGDQLGALAKLRRCGVPWDATLCATAADRGNLSMLKWARAHGAPWDTKALAAAAGNGNLQLVEWMWYAGAPRDATVCAEAARAGNLEALQWLRARGCPWDSTTMDGAAYARDVPTLQWAYDSGCAYDASSCLQLCDAGAWLRNPKKTATWLKAHPKSRPV